MIFLIAMPPVGSSYLAGCSLQYLEGDDKKVSDNTPLPNI